MPIGFLVPLFLAGVAAVGIPIWIHLTRKQRSLVVPFPSLMFLRQVPFKEDRRRTLHHWLLFSLRALAIMLLVAAFARPFLSSGTALAGLESGPREVVVLLDRSRSMAAHDRWEAATEAVQDEVALLGPLDRGNLIVFDQGADAVVRSESDPARLRAALDTLKPGSGTTRFGPGLKLAQAILEESGYPVRELVMVSDFQRSGWAGEEGARLPASTEVRVIPITSNIDMNVAVADVLLRRDRFSGLERVAPSARLVRTDGEESAEIDVILEVDEREIQRRSVTVPATGTIAVDFAPIPLATRHMRGTVRIPPDDLPGDDALHFVLSPGSALPIRIFTRSNTSGETTLFLERALGISEGGTFDVTTAPWNVGAADVLEPGQVVVLVDVPFPLGAAGTGLREFVEAGGGLVIVAGQSGGWNSNEDAWVGARIGAAVDRLDRGGGRIGQVDYDHPVFQVFRGPRSGRLTGTRFFRYRTLVVPDRVGVLARFDDGGPALVERRAGEGRVLIWTSTMDATWNDLALQPIFLPLVHQLVRYASGRSETLPWFTAGQVLDVSDARAMATAGLLEASEQGTVFEGDRVVIDPAGDPVWLPDEAGPHYLTLRDAGFYTMRPPGDAQGRPLAVAVNVDIAESDLTAMDPEEVSAALAATVASAGAGTPSSAVALRRADIERRQSIWRWLMVAVLALLAVETVMANRRSPAMRRRDGHAWLG